MGDDSTFHVSTGRGRDVILCLCMQFMGSSGDPSSAVTCWDSDAWWWWSLKRGTWFWSGGCYNTYILVFPLDPEGNSSLVSPLNFFFTQAVGQEGQVIEESFDSNSLWYHPVTSSALFCLLPHVSALSALTLLSPLTAHLSYQGRLSPGATPRRSVHLFPSAMTSTTTSPTVTYTSSRSSLCLNEVTAR